MAAATWGNTTGDTVLQLHRPGYRDRAANFPAVRGCVSSELPDRLAGKRLDWQSGNFSPAVASVLTAPLPGFACLIVSPKLQIAASFKDAAIMISGDLIIVGPVFLILTPLLAIYLVGGFRRKKNFGMALCAIAIGCVILQFAGLGLLYGQTS